MYIACLVNLMLLLLSADFSKFTFSDICIRKMMRVSNALNLDQAQHFLSLIRIQSVCKGSQQTTKVAASKEPGESHLNEMLTSIPL